MTQTVNKFRTEIYEALNKEDCEWIDCLTKEIAYLKERLKRYPNQFKEITTSIGCLINDIDLTNRLIEQRREFIEFWRTVEDENQAQSNKG
jgi:hypothetical protein